MLSRFSSLSGKRLIISFLQKFISSVQSKSAPKLTKSTQHLGLANFSSSNNYTINNPGQSPTTIIRSNSRAFSTNYFKPIHQQQKANNQRQDKIMTMLKSTDSFSQNLEVLDSFWSQCSDSSKTKGLSRLARLPKERMQIRLNENRNRIKGLYEKILQDIKNKQFSPKQLNLILDFMALIQFNFPFLINSRQLENFASKIKQAIENPNTQFVSDKNIISIQHTAMLLFSKSGALKSQQIVQSFWKKTLENQQVISVTPKITIQLINSLKYFDRPHGLLHKIFSFFSRHCVKHQSQFQLKDTIKLFRVYSDLSSKFQPKRNDYIKLQNILVQSMQNFEQDDVIDILYAFKTSKGRIIKELPQYLYKFLNLGIKHNSNTYSFKLIQRLINLIPQMSNIIVKPNKQFISSIFQYMMSRSNSEFNNKPFTIGSKMIHSLAKLANQYQINQISIAHFLLESAPSIRLYFCRIQQIQELTLCFKNYINKQNEDQSAKQELQGSLVKEFMKLSSNKENPSQGDFIKRIVIAHILQQDQAKLARIEQYKQFIEQIENSKFLLDSDVVKFIQSSRYFSQESKGPFQLIFQKNEIFEAFKQVNQKIQWSIYLMMNSRERRSIFPQTFKSQVQQYIQNMSLGKEFKMMMAIFSDNSYHLLNNDILNQILKIIKRIEKRLEEDGNQTQQITKLKVQYLQLLHTFNLRHSRTFQNKKFIADFLNNELESLYSKLKQNQKARVFSVLRSFNCPQSIRVQIAKQFETDIIGGQLAKLNFKSIGYILKVYTNHILQNVELEEKKEKVQAFLKYLAKFTFQIQQLNKAFDQQEAIQQRKKLTDAIKYQRDREIIIQNCIDVQTSLGKLRKHSKELIQRLLQKESEGQEFQIHRKNLKQIEELIKICEDFYLHAIKFDNPNNPLLLQFLAQVLEMESSAWIKFSRDNNYRQSFNKQILKKVVGMSKSSWNKLFQNYQKITNNWTQERFYGLRAALDPRRNIMNQFVRQYQTMGAQFRPQKNAGLLKLSSLGKIKNITYINSYLANFGDRYRSHSFSQLVSVVESLGQLGLVHGDLFYKMKNKNQSPYYINNLVAVGARNMCFDQDWFKMLVESHTKQVFEFFMSNDALDTHLTTFLASAYILFKRQGFEKYEQLIPKVFQLLAQQSKDRTAFNKNLSTYFVYRLSSFTNYLPQNLKIPDLKMKHYDKQNFTLKNKFNYSNQKENKSIFRSDLAVRNWNLNSVVLQALNKNRESDQQEIGMDGLIYFRDGIDIHVPSRELGIVVHGMKDYCFDGQRANYYHFLRHQEALASNLKNIVFLELPEYRKISTREDLVQFISTKLQKKEE